MATPAATVKPGPQTGTPQPPRALAPLQRAEREVPSYAQLRELLPQWSGECMEGIVANEARETLAVLWLGMGDVLLAGTAESVSTAHANSVRERLTGKLHLTLMQDMIVAPGVIHQVLDPAAASARARSGIEQVNEESYSLRVYDDLFRAAIESRASDIHISMRKDSDESLIALRMHGRYRPWREDINAHLLRAMLGASFNRRFISKTNSKAALSFDNEVAFMTENRAPDGTLWNGRCNGRPDVHGYKLVIRLLESNPQVDRIPDLKTLGYVPSHRDILEMAVRRNFGVIIIFGSTGSGKSTTLRTFIVKVTDPKTLSVYAVESPTEYVMPRVTQISIPVDVNMRSEDMSEKFTAALRDVMRMDPDVLMVGEIRDNESGKLVAEFTQSGHRCYTTSHGDGCVEGLQRMCGQQIQMPSELFAGQKFLSASIYQRLLPQLCEHCRVRATDPQRGLPESKLAVLRSKFHMDPCTMFVADPAGCEHCQPKIAGLPANGTSGVTVAAEVLIPTQRIRELIGARDWAGVTRAWRATRTKGFGDGDMHGKTAYECALYLAAEGLVSISDIEAEFEPLESYEIFPIEGSPKGNA